MVNPALFAPSTAIRILAATDAAARQDEIPPGVRATALFAYLGVVLLGIFLVVGVVIATRWIRRQVRDRDDRSGSVR